MKKIFIFVLSLFLVSCTTFDIEKRSQSFLENPSFGLQSGPSTTISTTNKDEVLSKIGYYENNNVKIKKIWEYIELEYSPAPITDGANSRKVDELIQTKTLRHCGEYAVLWVSLLRLYGIPCRFISGLNIIDAKNLTSKSWSGHKFIEAYVNHKYMIIDSTRGLYFEDSIVDRIIPIKIDNFAPLGFIVMMTYFDPSNVVNENHSWNFYVNETKQFFNEKGIEPSEFLVGKKIEELNSWNW